METHRWIKLYFGMYHQLITSLLLFLFHTTTSSGTGFRYEYHTGNYVANWTSAVDMCSNDNGKLAGDIDIDDWEIIFGKSGVFMDDTLYWIGLNRQPNKKWRWLSGDDLDINLTTAFPLRPEYQDNITWDCVLWGVKQPFFVPQDCDMVLPFICEMNDGFQCDFLKKEHKKMNDTGITVYNSKTEMDQAKTDQSLPEIYYLVYSDITDATCRANCSSFNERTGPQCWLYEFSSNSNQPLCRMVISNWKPVLYNLLDDSSVTLYSKYCVEVEKFSECPLGEECMCGNVTVPPNQEQLEEILEETKKKLTVPKQNLSSTVRKKTSAPDPRPASMTMGYFGISMLTITFGGLVLLDCSSLIADFKMMFYNLQCSATGKETFA